MQFRVLGQQRRRNLPPCFHLEPGGSRGLPPQQDLLPRYRDIYLVTYAREKSRDLAGEPARGDLERKLHANPVYFTLTRGTVRPAALDCAAIATTVAASRFLFRSRMLYDIDSVNFALALNHFDPAVHQPHPPGYYLYICSGRLVNAVLHDANASLVAISVIASALAGVFLYFLTREWFGRRAALFAAGLFLFSPLCWFHGTVALTYIVEAFFSALIGFLCWRVYSHESRSAVAAAVALGVSAGFRPSSLLFLGPMWLYSLRMCSRRNQVIAGVALAGTLVAWVVPMLISAGGPAAYFAPLWTLWTLIPARQSTISDFPFLLVARLGTIAAAGSLCFGAPAVLLTRGASRCDPSTTRIRNFALIWIAPGVVFFSFVFLRFVNSGYLLVLSPPFFALLGLCAESWFSRVSRRVGITAVAAAAAANAAIYLFAPLYCSYGQVRRFEADLNRTINAVRSNFSPATTMIVGFDSHFLGYRHAAYYLPEFMTVQFPAARTAQGKRIFAVEHRRTELIRELPADRYRAFVLFPLPDGAEYRAFSARQQARFPAGFLRDQTAGAVSLVSGKASGLTYLFPAGVSVSEKRRSEGICKLTATLIRRKERSV
jgi:hypothetical protein